MRNDPDLTLIQRIARGDTEALDALYKRHGLWLLNVLINRCGDRASAEDALQEVMVSVWRGAAKFRADSLVTTWLYGIARRQAFRRIDRHPIRWDDLFAAADPETTLDVLAREKLRDAISRLPAPEQEALEVVYYRGYTLTEAAEQLDISVNTLKSRLIRARKRLRHLLGEAFKELDDAP